MANPNKKAMLARANKLLAEVCASNILKHCSDELLLRFIKAIDEVKTAAEKTKARERHI